MAEYSGVYYSIIDNSKVAKVGRTSTTASQNALSDTSITEIKLKNYVTINNVIYKCEQIESYAFYSCDNLLKCVIPSTIKKINSFAFAYCHNLRYISLEEDSKLEEIGEKAFYDGFYRYEFFLMSQNLKIIGAAAFQFNIKTQKTVVIPANVKTIGDGAFGGITNLTDLYYCGPKPFEASIFDDFGTNRIPETFNIHVTSKYSMNTFGGKSVTEFNYSGMFCPSTKQFSCKRKQNVDFNKLLMFIIINKS